LEDFIYNKPLYGYYAYHHNKTCKIPKLRNAPLPKPFWKKLHIEISENLNKVVTKAYLDSGGGGYILVYN